MARVLEARLIILESEKDADGLFYRATLAKRSEREPFIGPWRRSEDAAVTALLRAALEAGELHVRVLPFEL